MTTLSLHDCSRKGTGVFVERICSELGLDLKVLNPEEEFLDDIRRAKHYQDLRKMCPNARIDVYAFDEKISAWTLRLCLP